MVKTMARYDPSHDALHGAWDLEDDSNIPIPYLFVSHIIVQRVRRTALKLALEPSISSRSPDLLVTEISALLHDVLDKKYVPESLSSNPHAFFLPMFEELDKKHPTVGLLAQEGMRARLIVDIVTNVSWTTEEKLREGGKWGAWHDSCLELHCVQDADRLDAIGAFGTHAIWSLRVDVANNKLINRDHEVFRVHCSYLKVSCSNEPNIPRQPTHMHPALVLYMSRMVTHCNPCRPSSTFTTNSYMSRIV